MDVTERGKRVLLLAVMSVLALNTFTGSPLFAVWVGSRVQGDGPPTMAAFGSAALTLVATSYLLVRLLAFLGSAYDGLVGRRPTVRAHVPWLRSLRGERPHEVGSGQSPSALEVILVAVVFLAVAAFEVWFVFYSTSPIDQRSGRH